MLYIILDIFMVERVDTMWFRLDNKQPLIANNFFEFSLSSDAYLISSTNSDLKDFLICFTANSIPSD
jgi:hypothetical protein